jgi:hypothetical protein
MLRTTAYLLFGLCVLGAYWTVLRNAYVFSSADKTPAPPSARAHTAGTRVRPTYWTTGYHGGK